jgi:hypothetical protein
VGTLRAQGAGGGEKSTVAAEQLGAGEVPPLFLSTPSLMASVDEDLGAGHAFFILSFV